VPELIQGGHQVVGLARSDASAAAVKAMGAEVRRGDLGDLAGLRGTAADADAVIHLASDHATMSAGDFPGAVAADMAVVQALGDVLADTGKTLVGVGLTHTGDAKRDAAIDANPRSAVPRAIARLTDRGVRTILVAIPPVTHSTRDRHGFIPTLIKIARDTGVSGYVGDGANHWPAGHVLDIGPPPGPPDQERPGRAGRRPLQDLPVHHPRHHDAQRGNPATTGLGAGPARPDRRSSARPLLHHQLSPPRATVLFAHGCPSSTRRWGCRQAALLAVYVIGTAAHRAMPDLAYGARRQPMCLLHRVSPCPFVHLSLASKDASHGLNGHHRQRQTYRHAGFTVRVPASWNPQDGAGVVRTVRRCPGRHPHPHKGTRSRAAFMVSSM
jgi:hypothetical protein